jgi:hypothetical protein
VLFGCFSENGPFRQPVNGWQAWPLLSWRDIVIIWGRETFLVHGLATSPRLAGLLWISEDDEIASVAIAVSLPPVTMFLLNHESPKERKHEEAKGKIIPKAICVGLLAERLHPFVLSPFRIFVIPLRTRSNSS